MARSIKAPDGTKHRVYQRVLAEARSSEGKGQLLSYAGILAASTDSIGPPRDVLIDDVPGAEDPPTVAIRASGYMVVGTRAGSDKGGMLLSYVPRRRGH